VETGSVVGIERGLKVFSTDSDGQTVENLPSSSPRRGSPRTPRRNSNVSIGACLANTKRARTADGPESAWPKPL
jgi:hypothetical protein